MKTRFYCEATVVRWSPAFGEMEEIDLDHYSTEPDAQSAEDDAREAWSDHGMFPETVTVRPIDAPARGNQ